MGLPAATTKQRNTESARIAYQIQGLAQRLGICSNRICRVTSERRATYMCHLVGPRAGQGFRDALVQLLLGPLSMDLMRERGDVSVKRQCHDHPTVGRVGFSHDRQEVVTGAGIER